MLEGKNPIGTADLKWIFARNREGTEQLRYKSVKTVLLESNQPVFFHSGEFCGQSAPVHREIIRELLAVKGDPEGLFLLFFRLKG